MKRKRFSKEFKLEALRLLDCSDKSGAVLAGELGVRRNQLYKWRRELQLQGKDGAFNGPWQNAARSNVSEITAPKRRLARLEEENAILKKAEAYFTSKPR